MKKTLISLLGVAMMVIVAMPASAQKGAQSAGVQIVFGSGEGISNTGVGLKYRYNVSNPLRLEGAFTYFFEKNTWTMWDLSINAHYLFDVAPRLTLYPLAGLGILGTRINNLLGKHSYSDFGLNLGAGVEYMLSQQWSLGAEFRFHILNDWDRSQFSIGATYAF